MKNWEWKFLYKAYFLKIIIFDLLKKFSSKNSMKISDFHELDSNLDVPEFW